MRIGKSIIKLQNKRSEQEGKMCSILGKDLLLRSKKWLEQQNPSAEASYIINRMAKASLYFMK